jgi:VWFA-related protein
MNPHSSQAAHLTRARLRGSWHNLPAVRKCLLLSVVASMLAVSGAAQQQPEPAMPAQPAGVTFRTEVNFVEVHAIVTDETGAFVRGLTSDDFEIYEDGRAQKPATFSLIDLPIERRRTAVGGEPVEPDVRATTRTFDGRLYVFLLDDLHTDARRSLQVRDTARRFVQQYLGANDLAAVVYTSGRQEAGQELTGSARLLLAAIDRFQGRKLPSAGAEKLAVHLRQAATQDVLADEPQAGRTAEGLQAARSIRDPNDEERGLNARRALDAVRNVADWLADVQGRRKALLFFSEGLDYDIYDPFTRSAGSSLVTTAQATISAAQRANVNVYAIDPRGLSQFGGLIDISGRSDYPQLEYGTFRGALRELLLSQESLISLADETGGLAVVNAGDVIGGLGRIVLDNSRYYLLGYYSDSRTWSRRFLKVEVRVTRPGVQVRARRGFMPPDPNAAAKTRAAEAKAGTSPSLRAALSRPVPVGELPFRVFAAPFKGSGANASLLIALEIDGAALSFQERNGRFAETLEVSIVAADQRSKVQGTDRQTFDMNLLPPTYERVRSTGIRLLSRLEVPAGRYQLHVGVHESTGGALATVPIDVEVPDYSQMPFGLSGLVLSSSDADRLVTANPELVAKDMLPGAPVVSRTFSPTETLVSFAQVYDNTGRTAHAIAFTAAIRDARDGRVVFEAQDRRAVEGSPRAQAHPFSTELPLKNLPPGQYILRATAASTVGGHSVERSVPFEIR